MLFRSPPCRLLYIPDSFDLSKNYPAVVVTDPMLSVKEQAQSVYAKRLTEAGHVTLVFDGTYFGESEGMPRGQELPDVKETDIEGAVDYLCSLPSWTANESVVWVSVAPALICPLRAEEAHHG